MQKRMIPVLLAAALFISGLISLFFIHNMQGNARVINYAGVVRGGTQRLIKQELSGQPNDALITRLDGILNELSTGEGDNSLARLDDDEFQTLITQMQAQWADIKDEIIRVRQGNAPAQLYEKSETYFTLADHTVSAAESYSEDQVTRIELGLFAMDGIFLLICGLLAWDARMQSGRQKILKEAEDRNRAEKEKLARMHEDLLTPMNELSELVYVCDPETYDLLFINETGRETFGVSSLDGQKCHKVLQGLDSPCDFCPNAILKPGENYTWEITNPITKRHYLLKDRLILWNGRTTKMEIAFDITESDAEKQALKQALDTELMVMECVRTLYQEHDLQQSFPAVLEQLGHFLCASRIYIFMVRDDWLHADFAWHDRDSEFKGNFMQGIPLSALSRWRTFFKEQGYILMEDIESIKTTYKDEYELLHTQDTRCLAAVPLEQDGCLKGILGIHNSTPERIQAIVPLLQTLCYFLMLAYRRTESEQQLSKLSYYDTLTSFYNRNRYIRDTAALEGCAETAGVVYLDVNGLKDINDQQGHAYGDKVLIECARQMREIFGEASYYRIGGDEFVIICPDMDKNTFDAKVASLRRCFLGNEICKAAIGAQWNEQFRNVQEIIAAADASMYEDKKEFYRQNPVSNRYRHLSDEMLHLSDPEVLKEELRQEHFVVYFQPKVSSSDRLAVGAEALIRYQTRTGSLILPGNFLSMLEEGESVSHIDFYVFEYACSRLKDWIMQGRQVLPVSVNFSRSSLSQPDFVSRLTGLCEKYGVEKKYLEIELTETAHEAVNVNLKTLISSLRQAGFIVSIDDFGTEFANLTILSSADFDVLKLDKSLMDDVAHNPKARSVVESITTLCREMGISVVAEGIESEEQLEVLHSCGVELAQGYLFSRPIPIEEYENKYLS